MSYTRLFIGGQECDLPLSGLDASLVYQIQDLSEPAGGYAKRSITIPYTKRNEAIFADWLNPTATDLSPSMTKPFRLERNGLPIFAGQAQLESGTAQGHGYHLKGQAFKVSLFAQNADWSLLTTGRTLAELPYETQVWDSALVLSRTINAAWNGTDDYAFTLIKYKEWATAGKVDFSEFTPALYVAAVVQKIFASVGWTVNSQFFSTDFGKRLIMPLHPINKYGQLFTSLYTDFAAELLVNAYTYPADNNKTIEFDNVTQLPSLNPGLYASGVYTVPYDGFYLVESTVITVSTAALSNIMTFQLRQNGLTVFAQPREILSGQTQSTSISRVLSCAAGDTINLVVTSINAQTFDISTATLKITAEVNDVYGLPLHVPSFLRNWEQNQFLLGLAHLFNLRFESDTDAKTVTIEPAYEYFDGAGLNQGFYGGVRSLPVDLLPESELFNETDYPQSEQFQYKQDPNDPTFAYVIEGQTTQPPYAATYNQPANRFSGEPAINENPFFAATLQTVEAEIERTSTSYISPLLPIIYPQNYILDPTATQAGTEFEPRILYLANNVGKLTPQIKITGGTIVLPLSFATFNILTTTPYNESLSFAQLLPRFHLRTLASKTVGKRLETYAFWDELSLSGVSFREFVNFDGAYWVLNRIDGYNPLRDQSTKTVLTIDKYPDSTDQSRIDDQAISNIVQPQ